MPDQKYRLVTRADFDGVVCGVLMNEMELIDDVLFVEPGAMQRGEVDVTGRDITTNLPYIKGVHLCFDHHMSELERVDEPGNRVIDPDAPSAARVVYRYYGGHVRFPEISTELMDAVDQADSAQYTVEDILAPARWTFLNFIMDPRTGLSRFKDFTIDNDQLMRDLMIYCRRHSIDEILHLPDLTERRELYYAHEENAEFQIRDHARIDGDVVVLDFHDQEVIYACNRFMVYALFPECGMSLHILPGSKDGTVQIAAGRSIIKRTNKVNIGSLMLEYGGGGHAAAGTCQVAAVDAERVVAEVVQRLNA